MAGTDRKESPPETGKEIPEGEEKKGPWWRKSDAELIKDRYDKVKRTLTDRKMEVDQEDRAPLVEEARKRDPRLRNLLDQRIVRKRGVRLDDNMLLVPIYRSDWCKRIAEFLHLRTERKIHLDDYGVAVWRSINGKRNVRQMGKILRREFGDEVEPLYPRLSKFLAYFQSLGLIAIRTVED